MHYTIDEIIERLNELKQSHGGNCRVMPEKGTGAERSSFSIRDIRPSQDSAGQYIRIIIE